MASAPQTVELPVTLRVSRQAQQTLAERAAASGMELGDYISTLVEQTTRGALSLEAISGDVYRRFLESGVSDDQLSEELEPGKHELRRQREGAGLSAAVSFTPHHRSGGTAS